MNEFCNFDGNFVEEFFNTLDFEQRVSMLINWQEQNKYFEDVPINVDDILASLDEKTPREAFELGQKLGDICSGYVTFDAYDEVCAWGDTLDSWYYNFINDADISEMLDYAGLFDEFCEWMKDNYPEIETEEE